MGWGTRVASLNRNVPVSTLILWTEQGCMLGFLSCVHNSKQLFEYFVKNLLLNLNFFKIIFQYNSITYANCIPGLPCVVAVDRPACPTRQLQPSRFAWTINGLLLRGKRRERLGPIKEKNPPQSCNNKHLQLTSAPQVRESNQLFRFPQHLTLEDEQKKYEEDLLEDLLDPSLTTVVKVDNGLETNENLFSIYLRNPPSLPPFSYFKFLVVKPAAHKSQ